MANKFTTIYNTCVAAHARQLFYVKSKMGMHQQHVQQQQQRLFKPDWKDDGEDATSVSASLYDALFVVLINEFFMVIN